MGGDPREDSRRNRRGSEIPGANPLEALEHALLHVKTFHRNHLKTGRLYDEKGNPFDPDKISPVYRARLEVEGALKGKRKISK